MAQLAITKQMSRQVSRGSAAPATGSQQCLQNASLGLCPHWLKSVVLAAFFAPRAFRGRGGGGLGPGGEGGTPEALGATT